MFETSKDILFLVIAFCVLWFTVFLCWALYYLTKLFKQTNQVVTDVRSKVSKVGTIFSFMRGKLFEQGLKGIMSFFGTKEKKTKKSKK